MTTRSFLVLYLLFIVVHSDLLLLPTGFDGTLEDPAETDLKCEEMVVQPMVEKYLNLTKLIEEVCNERTSSIRTKRFSFFPPPGLKRDRRKEEFNNELELYRGLLGKITLTAEHFDSFFSIVGGNGIAEKFGYSNDQFADAWVAAEEKNIQCTHEGEMVLWICGNYNSNRKRGTLESVVPVGTFSSRGTIYKTRKVPELAVVIDGRPHSVTKCRQLSSHYECSAPTDLNCTATKLDQCDEEAILTSTKVYTRNFATGFTLVAADADRYSTDIHGIYSEHPIDHSKHVILKLPIGTFARFNGIKVDGRATEDFDHFTVHHAPGSLFPLSVGDLDELEEKVGKHPEIAAHRIMFTTTPSPTDPVDTMIWLIVTSILLLCVAFLVLLLRRKQSTPSPFAVSYSAETSEVSIGFSNQNHEA